MIQPNIKRMIDACVILKSASVENPFSSTEIAKKMNVSGKYVEVILRRLRDAGIVKISKGIFGGAYLIVDSLSVGDLIRLGEKEPFDDVEEKLMKTADKIHIKETPK